MTFVPGELVHISLALGVQGAPLEIQCKNNMKRYSYTTLYVSRWPYILRYVYIYIPYSVGIKIKYYHIGIKFLLTGTLLPSSTNFTTKES